MLLTQMELVSGLLYSCLELLLFVFICPSKGVLQVGQAGEVRGSDHHLGLFSAPSLCTPGLGCRPPAGPRPRRLPVTASQPVSCCLPGAAVWWQGVRLTRFLLLVLLSSLPRAPVFPSSPSCLPCVPCLAWLSCAMTQLVGRGDASPSCLLPAFLLLLLQPKIFLGLDVSSRRPESLQIGRAHV